MFRTTTDPAHPHATLLELVDARGRMLSRVDMIDLRLWFGGCVVRVGGIASVFTPEEHRRKGYARQCMDEAIVRQAAGGHAFSLLFGIRDFYEPMGYVPVMPWYDIKLDVRMLGDLPPDGSWVDIPAAQRAQWDRWHNEVWASGCGAAARGADHAHGPHFPTAWSTAAVTRALNAADGSLCAVVVYGPPSSKGFEVAEVAAIDDAGHRAALVHLLHEAVRRGHSDITVVLPPSDPFALYLRRFDVPFIVTTRRSGGGMARLLDLRSWGEAWTPMLRRRAAPLKVATCPTALQVHTPAGQVTFELGGAAPLVRLQLSPAELTQLSFGYLPISRLPQTAGCEQLDRCVAAALFPAEHAFMHLIDRF